MLRIMLCPCERCYTYDALVAKKYKCFIRYFFDFVRPSERKGLDKAYYNLRGAAIGNTILTYSASPPNKPQITSEPKHIQVKLKKNTGFFSRNILRKYLYALLAKNEIFL